MTEYPGYKVIAAVDGEEAAARYKYAWERVNLFPGMQELTQLLSVLVAAP